MSKKSAENIFVSEIFGPTIQGEGALIGRPTVFVRTGGCDYRCSWCDTLYAVEPQYKSTWQRMSGQQILDKVKLLTDNQPILITLSGGNPAIHDLSELIHLGQQQGFTFSMETQGSIENPYFAKIDYLTISPKPPSAKVKTDFSKLAQIINTYPQTTLKIVVSDEADYIWAKNIHQQYPHTPMTLQPCNPVVGDGANTDINTLNDKLKWLIERSNQDHWYQVTLLPQLHVILWNNERGV